MNLYRHSSQKPFTDVIVETTIESENSTHVTVRVRLRPTIFRMITQGVGYWKCPPARLLRREAQTAAWVVGRTLKGVRQEVGCHPANGWVFHYQLNTTEKECVCDA